MQISYNINNILSELESLLYEKFKTTIDTYNLIPINKNRIYIFYSGGKDASTLAELFLIYKQKERPDLVLNLITILFPEIIYSSSDPTQIKLTNEAFNYWKSKGYNINLISLPEGIGDHLFEINSDTPCEICEICESVKTQIIFNELSKSHYNESIVCMAHTIDDITGYLSEIEYIAGSFNSWEDIMQYDHELFHRVAVLAKRVYPKYEPSNMNVSYIKPLIEIEELYLKKYIQLKKYPMIPECCTEKRGANFRIYKRIVMDGINWLDKKYKNDNFYNKLLYKDYKSLINFYKNTGILPSIEDIEQLGLKSGI